MKVLGVISAVLGIGVLLIPILAALGVRGEFWNFGVGIQLILLCTAIGLLNVILGLIFLPVSYLKKRDSAVKKGFWVGTVTSVLLVGYIMSSVIPALQSPPIHNISTDLAAVPEFSADMLELRGPGSNPVEMSDAVKERVRQGYPDLQPWQTDLSLDEVEEHVAQTIEVQGWEYHGKQHDSENPEIVTHFATDTTFWFGFKDDVAIRLAPTDSGGTVVDLRSVSRVGESDVGTNAARIRAFLGALVAASGS